jgi:hypothetical protein
MIYLIFFDAWEDTSADPDPDSEDIIDQYIAWLISMVGG